MDTILGAIAGDVIGFYKEMPSHIHDLATSKLPEHFMKAVNDFDKLYGGR